MHINSCNAQEDESNHLKAILSQPIGVLNLSVRSYNALRRVGIDCVFDLASREADLGDIRNLGQRSLAEIPSKLRQYLESNSICPSDILSLLSESSFLCDTSSPETTSSLGGEPDAATTILLAMTLIEAAEDDSMTPERWADFVARCKLLRTDVWSRAAAVPYKGKPATQPDPAFAHHLSARARNALMRVGVYDLVGASQLRIRDLVRIRQFGKKAIVELLQLIGSELPRLVRADSASVLQQREVSRVAEHHQAPIVPPEKNLYETRLKSILRDEVKAGRLHPSTRLEGLTVSQWIDLDRDTYEEKREFLAKLERRLSAKSIDDELAVALNMLAPRRTSIMLARFGQAPQTLQELGDKLGLTRERVRQLEQRACNIISRWLRQYPLRLKTALLLAKDAGNQISLRAWEAELVGKALLENGTVHLEEGGPEYTNFQTVLALLKANEHADQPCKEYVLPENLRAALQYPELAADEIQATRAISKTDLRRIRRQCRNGGAVSAVIVGRQLKLPASTVIKALSTRGFTKLDNEWLAPKRVPKVHVSPQYSAFRVNISKMLSVCGPLRLEEIHDGLQSHISKFHLTAPPLSVLGKLLEVCGFMIRGDGRVTSNRARAVNIKLSSGESAVLDAIRERGPIVNFFELTEEFSERGFSQPLLTLTLRHSVLFRHVDSGLYSLRGASFTRDDIENALARRPEIQQNGSLRYSSEGTITWEINVGIYGLGGTIPSGDAGRLAGRWQATIAGVESGQISVDEQRIWNLAKAFRKLRVGVGERVALQFDPKSRKVEIIRVERAHHEAE